MRVLQLIETNNGYDVIINNDSETLISDGLATDEALGQVAYFLKDKFRSFAYSISRDREIIYNLKNENQELKQQLKTNKGDKHV